MATTKRAYKLQEFVAHSSNVNCLKIGRKTSRVLVTGGDDNKVNIWAIGKPNAIMSLSGHMSAVESVSFDSSEVLVAAGAASGSIKLWDLEEAKIIRTLTGHRSNCIAVDFHPFGEFFASGSLDTNLKIWDMRRKGCIHTYKGHTRGVNAIKFTPDGRWVVSGGEDNIVKLWDLTAGKLLHDFKLHEGQIQCIDFHPNEFLLATGSADRTVKFWDLETFELIGSAGPETSGVRSMTFNPDGRTLLCGLHESLKIFSWEPIRCHDAVDVGWSRLSDMNIHEGKLLGCSYNQSCVGVWVVDLSRIEPYAIASAVITNGHSELKSTSSGNLSLQADNNIKSSMGRLSISQSSEPNSKETKQVASATVVPGTPQRIATSVGQKATTITTAPVVTSVKRSSSKAQATTNLPTINKSEIIPVVVPRTSPRFELSSDSTKSTGVGRTVPYDIQSKFANFQKVSNIRDDSDKSDMSVQSVGTEHNELLEQTAISSCNAVTQPVIAGENNLNDIKRVRTRRLGANLFRESSANYDQENYSIRVHKPKEACSFDVPKGGRTKSLVANWERRERSPTYDGPRLSSSSETMAGANSLYSLRGHNRIAEKEIVPAASDEDAISFVLEKHDQFLNVAQSRLTKLQIVYRLWERNDIKGVISAIEKMSDHAVSADVLSSLMDKSDIITLDICTALLPLLASLLESKMDRHLGISLEMLLKLVRIFGPVISSTLSAGPSVGVDLQAEQRLERCNLCFIELEKVKHRISLLIRRGGSIAKSAKELNLALQNML
uniref:Katanin p80 WD40 repeat-containing subunit B1 homolog n=1 Tax=Musa acuminata subsp. malaccensis TaxID=214687 RepID=A0A804KN53_MUSAM|nr:PREDICTED: katanin p80 WD40 repeat-containing subunit B1 homolog isoform X1 [Musa acuminata subsp. malaccensis]